MFTGIITDIGIIQSVYKTEDGSHLVIQCTYDMDAVDIGASIACSGCCLTVTQKEANTFHVDVSNESLCKTNIGSWQVGMHINLERAFSMGDELGGHIVTGHVDGLAALLSCDQDGESWRLVFDVPDDLAGMIVPKGSVALDGVSLTVNEVHDTQFGVNIIPHTWENTTLRDLQVNDAVHCEVDILARYVARALAYQVK